MPWEAPAFCRGVSAGGTAVGTAFLGVTCWSFSVLFQGFGADGHPRSLPDSVPQGWPPESGHLQRLLEQVGRARWLLGPWRLPGELGSAAVGSRGSHPAGLLPRVPRHSGPCRPCRPFQNTQPLGRSAQLCLPQEPLPRPVTAWPPGGALEVLEPRGGGLGASDPRGRVLEGAVGPWPSTTRCAACVDLMLWALFIDLSHVSLESVLPAFQRCTPPLVSA